MKAFNIFVSDSENLESSGTRRMDVRGEQKGHGTRMVEVPSEELIANMSDFLENTQELLAQGEKTDGPYKVDTVEITAQISVEGKVGFMGSGLGLKGDTGIKFVFKKI
ncbi:MAG: hypothetical protein U9R66_11565 [Thermodesulfobacteriota bacterium]|nr:hypothetical protein [Thermodesulfobacteriota bacterium]